MYATPQNVFTMAGRCADCPDCACIKACPEHLDLRTLFQFIAAQSPLPVSWQLNEREAEVFADDAIELSFTPWFH